METITLLPKRKVIDLSADTFRSLSVMAAKQGTNLKKLIEGLLDNAAEEFDDSEAYAWLIQNFPEGKVMVSPEEKAEFEAWLGI